MNHTQLRSSQHLSNISINDEWETQTSDILNAIKKYQISPIIDVFATDENFKFSRYFTKQNSAFDHELKQNSFANPMYSMIDKCIKFLYHQHLKNNIEISILTYNKTDTKWWHKYVEDKAEIHFIKGRLRFSIDGIIPRWCKNCKTHFTSNVDFCVICSLFKPVRLVKNTAPYPSCWIIYRKKK